MEFSRQEYWGGLLFPPQGDLPDLGTEPTSLVSPALADRFFILEDTLFLLIKKNYLFFAVGPCWLFIFSIAVCTC